MANTFHVSIYVGIPMQPSSSTARSSASSRRRSGPDYAKFELADPPVIFSLIVGGEPGTVSHLGIRYPGTGEVATEMARAKNAERRAVPAGRATCCYAKADKFWVKDADGMPWEMYTLLADVEAETAADPNLRRFLGQGASGSSEEASKEAACCAKESACGA